MTYVFKDDAQGPSTGKDFLIEMIADIVESSVENRIPLTFQMHGFLVSGLLIPSDVYYERLGKQMGEEFSNEIATLIARTKAKRASVVHEDLSVNYAHMQDCSFYPIGSGAITTDLWRGRVSEIQGFFFGKLDKKPAS